MRITSDFMRYVTASHDDNKHHQLSLHKTNACYFFLNIMRNQYHNIILASKKKHFYSNLVSSSPDNPKRIWQTVNKLLHRKSSSPLPYSTPGIFLADSLASYFTDKVSNLSLSLSSNPTTSSPHSPILLQHL